jgi:Histone-like transcription factor (CBF/NF-Y) and archaeal histone
MNKEALVLLTKATEMFVQDLAGVCGKIAKMQKRKTMQLTDLMNVASSIDKFHFIKGKHSFFNAQRADCQRCIPREFLSRRKISVIIKK